MRLHKSRYAPLALFAIGVFAAGCVEVNHTIDRAQACLEAPRIVTELGAELTRLTNDPQAMNRALDDAAAKLNDVADKAANTTIKDASEDFARTLSGINVNNVNDAVDAAQKVTADSAAYVERITRACTG